MQATSTTIHTTPLDYGCPMKLAEIMTPGAVTASPETSIQEVARLMRDQNVGSVVIVGNDRPIALVTDRDLAVGALADARAHTEVALEFATQPVVCGEPEMELEEAAALMVQNQIRRLPIMDGKELVGIVTLDDIAIRTGDLEVAKKMTSQVTEAALPEYYFRRD